MFGWRSWFDPVCPGVTTPGSGWWTGRGFLLVFFSRPAMMILPVARRRLECSSWASSRRVDGTLAAMGTMHVPPLCPGSGAGSTAMHPPVVVRARGRFGDAVGQLRLFSITAKHATACLKDSAAHRASHASKKVATIYSSLA